MLTIAKGYDTGYLTASVAQGREGYYTDAVETGTEPPGRWYGTGAEDLGLSGEVDADVLERLYSQLQDPRGAEEPLMTRPQYRSAEQIHADLIAAEPDDSPTPERRDELWSIAQGRQRQAVSFFDATFSAPKSVSVLGVAFERAAVEAEEAGREEEAEAWRAHHAAVEEAVMVGARAVIDYLEEVAGYSRAGKHGAGADRWIDAHRFTVAQFLQHDSRDRDPQLHVHQAILNGVQCSDGTWRTLDSTALYLHRGAASAIGERAMEAFLTETLGVRFVTRPDGKAREVVGVDQDVMDMFSARTRAVGRKLEQLCEAWEARYGSPPPPVVRSRLSKQATLLSRPAKAHDGETLPDRLSRWEQQTRREVGQTLNGIAREVLAARQDSGPADRWDPTDVVERAVAHVAMGESTWTRSDLMRAVSNCLPGHLDLPPDQVRPLLERLTDAAVETAVQISPDVDLSLRPDDHLLADGGDVYARPGSSRYSAPDQLPAEQALRAAAVERGAIAVSDSAAAAVLARYGEHGFELGTDQAAALRGVMTSGAFMEVLAAPAGTGKTVVVGALTEAWAEQGRAVLGLAPSQVAADVMVDEGVAAVNIDRWLMRHYSGLTAGDIVVVDEAGMASTQHLQAVQERCRAVGAKLLLVGDPEQLGAVGPGGGFADLTHRACTYELSEVRRFTHPWEREASLRLRAGDPTSLDDYERAGRIRSGGTQEQAEAAAIRSWLADTLEGKQSLLMAGTNEAAERMAGAARRELVRLGLIPDDGIILARDGNGCAVGDLVQARRNGWHLTSGAVPINRATYRVHATHADGSLDVCPVIGDTLGPPVTLPADYVAEHITLGYASTVHAGQGRTVDTAHFVAAPGSSRSQTYVGLTRGRQSNTAWCVTRPTPTDSPAGQAQEIHERTGRAVLADIIDRESQELSALAEQATLDEANRSELSVVGQLLDGIHRSTAGQTGHLLDVLAARGAITEAQRMDLATDEAMSAVERLLRSAELAGHDRADVLERALEGRSLADALSPGQVLHHRIHRDLQVTGTLTSYHDLIPASVPDYHRVWLESRADDADTRRHELGARVAEDPPVWALQTLGPVPADALARQDWEARAGWAAAYREMAGHDDEQVPLGSPPPAGLAEKLAVYRTAREHLDLVDGPTEEALLTDGQLRVRVAAWERERTWAAADVRQQLRDTSQAADERRVDGLLREAHGDETALDAQAEALVLARSAGMLDDADRARQAWWDHTAATRENARASAAELRARGVGLDAGSRVSAEEWLAAHAAEQVEDELWRPIDQVASENDETELVAVDEHAPETLIPDVRETALRHPSEDNDVAGVPSTVHVRDLIARAQETLVEISQRQSLDEAAEVDGYSHYDEDDLTTEDEDVAAWD